MKKIVCVALFVAIIAMISSISEARVFVKACQPACAPAPCAPVPAACYKVVKHGHCCLFRRCQMILVSPNPINSDNGLDNSDNGLNNPDNGLNNSDNGLDNSDNGLNNPDNGSNKPDNDSFTNSNADSQTTNVNGGKAMESAK